MNILLVYPKIPETFWSFIHVLKFIGKKAALPPLGLLTVAAMLPEKWKNNLKLIDLNVGTKLTDKDLEQTDLVFISGMTLQRDSAMEIIERCKEKGVKTVAGGPLFMMEPENFNSVDYLFLSEVTTKLMKQFAEDLQDGKASHVYKLDKFPDLKTTPAPMFKLLDSTLESYAGMTIISQQGCPNNCDFCNVTLLFGHKIRTKTIFQIITELDILYKLGWQGGILLADDNFVGNPKRLKEKFLPALIKWNKNKHISFSAQVTIGLSDDKELMELMIKAGIETLFVGIETPNEKSLVGCNKQSNTNRNMIADIETMQAFGFIVNGGFIVGFDNDSLDIFEKMTKWIQESGIVTAMVGVLQAPPGTKLFKRLEEEGRITDTEITGINFKETNIDPKEMSIEELQEGFVSILKNIYSPLPYYKRIKTFLSKYKPSGRQTISFKASYIFVGFKTVVSFGILGKGKRYFWKLLLWTLFTRPRLIPLAISLFVTGRHFRIISEISNL